MTGLRKSNYPCLVLPICMLIWFASACKNGLNETKSIPPATMAAIMADLAWSEAKYNKTVDTDSLALRRVAHAEDSIFKHYKITAKSFKKALSEYSKDKEAFAKLCQQSIDTLQFKKDSIIGKP